MTVREDGPPARAGLPEHAIFTVGHSTLSLRDFTAVLAGYGITRLVDVRTIPRSRHNPQFNADALARQMAAVGIDYLPMPALAQRYLDLGCTFVAVGVDVLLFVNAARRLRGQFAGAGAAPAASAPGAAY